ncbi:MAG: polyisoprenoid-binding protein [Nitrospirae bacterium]|nr:MAG: polyisoprenoid-binding protein [Nitrospirota bacterium]
MKRILMKTACAIAAAIVFATSDARAATERYNVDPDHSIVGFSVAHMVVSKTTGRFKDYSGFIEMDPAAKTVKALEAVIQTDSIDTNHVKRDTHLRSPDFLNVEKYPTMTYKMKSYEKIGDNQYMAKGDLTLLGVTREVVLTGTFNGLVPKDPMGNTRAGFTAHGKINRQDFGMKWSKVLDSGGLVVGDDVDINLEVEVIKQK